MLSHKNILRLLTFTAIDANVETLKTFLAQKPSIKHKPLAETLRIADGQTRQAMLANLLWNTPGFLQKAEDRMLGDIFALLEQSLADAGNVLSDPENSTQFCQELLTLSGLHAEVRKTIQAFVDLGCIFDEAGTIKPVWQMPVGDQCFTQLERSGRSFAKLVHDFFPGTFDTHATLDDEAVEEEKKQAEIDLPRETFHFNTPHGTIIWKAIDEALTAEELVEEEITTEEPIKDGLTKVKFYTLNLMQQDGGRKLITSWDEGRRKKNPRRFVEKVFETINHFAPMDEALQDFCTTYLLNQQGPHGLPAIMFQALIHAMAETHFDSHPYDLAVCLNALQNAFRMKQLVLTYVNEHELQMSWVGEEEHFMVTIKNKFYTRAIDQAAARVCDGDGAQPKNNFRDITVCLERFSIPIDAAEFAHATPIKETEAYKNQPELELTYQTCCTLFWQVYAAYVIQTKAGVENTITKENDIPALLMRCAEDPLLQSKAVSERTRILKAIAFHWIKLINHAQQRELKIQMSWPVSKTVAKLPDEVKMMFAIPIGSALPSLTSLSNFWNKARSALASPAATPARLSTSSDKHDQSEQASIVSTDLDSLITSPDGGSLSSVFSEEPDSSGHTTPPSHQVNSLM